jgi:hypothetical protein
MNEKDLRTLLIRATEDQPPGIDPMPTITHKPKRILLPSIAALGVAALVSVIVMVLPGSQLSAQAQVTAAVDNTSRESYRIHSESGDRTWEGAFDPIQHVGVITEAGDASETRFIGDLMYGKFRGETKWEVQPRPDQMLKNTPGVTALVKLAPLDPQAALQRLRAATDVREDGSASGPGWTGQRFTFSLTDQPDAADPKASGVVQVDDQGRVRRLEVTFADGHRLVMDISDYGTPVTVAAPPADEVVQAPVDKPTGPPDKPTGNPTHDREEPTKKPTATNP